MDERHSSANKRGPFRSMSDAGHSGLIRFFRENLPVGEVDFCEPQLNLLAHGQTIELFMGSRCGGHGVCGGDRIRVLNVSRGTLSPPTEKEIEHLSPEELQGGYRLACQCYPNDLHAEVSISLEY